MRIGKISITIFVLTFLSFIWISWVTFNPNNDKSGLVRFVSIPELDIIKIDERVRLGGLVKSGSISVSSYNQLECSFSLQQGEHNVNVFFSGIRPDMFKDEAEVIIEGNYNNGEFLADQLQTKCASRYEADLDNEASYQYKNI